MISEDNPEKFNIDSQFHFLFYASFFMRDKYLWGYFWKTKMIFSSSLFLFWSTLTFKRLIGTLNICLKNKTTLKRVHSQDNQKYIL